MRPIIIPEFENLYQKYSNAVDSNDRLIRLKLNEISLCYSECLSEDRTFANEITKKFCEIIELLNKQYEKNVSNNNEKASDTFLVSGVNNYMAYTPAFNQPLEQQSQYKFSFELLNDFYAHLIESHKESTSRDYVARVKTFADRYLNTVPRIWEIYINQNEIKDTVLFTYKYLELILANFDTKNENGETNKQKNNIRSALRKFNEFKQRNNL